MLKYIHRYQELTFQLVKIMFLISGIYIFTTIKVIFANKNCDFTKNCISNM